MIRFRLLPLLFIPLFTASVHSEESSVATEPTLSFDALTGNIELRNGEAPLTLLELSVSNPSEALYQGKVRFHDGDELDVSLAGGESTTLSLSPSVRHAGKTDLLQKTEIDLGLEIDGMEAPAVAKTDIDIIIPPAAYPLVRAEPPVMDNGRDNQAQYEYYALGQQTQPLTLTYNPGPLNLTVRKTVYPIPVETGPVEISIEVTNNGSETAQNLTLRDALSNSDFGGEGEAFSRFAASEDEIELVWQANIDALAPGESQRFNYTVTARYAVADKQLPATTVIMNDELTGLSNKVWLPKWH